MAGGTFTAFNKIRPGAYINVKSDGKLSADISNRGIVAIPMILSFGAEKTMISVDKNSDFVKLFGASLGDKELLLIKEALKRGEKALVYRLNGGETAVAKLGNLVATSKYSGEGANKLAVKVEKQAQGENFTVTTLFDAEVVATCECATAQNAQSNEYVEFSGEGDLVASAGVFLQGGENSDVTVQDYLDFFAQAALYDFNTMCIPSDDDAVKSAAVEFVRDMRQNEGKKCQVVVADYSDADYEGVISVKNGVVLDDGTQLQNVEATAFVAGATAGAQVNESLTYSKYDGAVDALPRYTNSEIIETLKAGEIVFVYNGGDVIIEQDINTLTSFDSEKSQTFAKNRVVRTLDAIATDIKTIFVNSYLGKVDNSVDGRGLFKATLIDYVNSLQEIGAIEAFDSQEDIEVKQGQSNDELIVSIMIKPVDSMEKLYMTVVVG